MESFRSSSISPKCTSHLGIGLGRVEDSKIKPLFLGNQEPQKSLCNRDVGPVLRSLDSRFPGNDGISEHALERVDKLLPKNDKERKPTGLTPYVASRR